MEFKVVLVDIPPPHHGVVLRNFFFLDQVCMHVDQGELDLLINCLFINVFRVV